MEKELLLKELTAIIEEKTLKLVTLKAEGDFGDISIPILEEEIEDCKFIINNDLTDNAMGKVCYTTTSNTLYDLIEGHFNEEKSRTMNINTPSNVTKLLGKDISTVVWENLCKDLGEDVREDQIVICLVKI